MAASVISPSSGRVGSADARTSPTQPERDVSVAVGQVGGLQVLDDLARAADRGQQRGNHDERAVGVVDLSARIELWQFARRETGTPQAD